jgi:hypothetical protein
MDTRWSISHQIAFVISSITLASSMFVTGCGTSTETAGANQSSGAQTGTAGSTIPAPPPIPPTPNPVVRTGPTYIVGVDYPNLESCVAGVALDSTCLLQSGYAESPTTGILINESHLTVACQPGVYLTETSTAPVVTIAANDVVIDGCTFNGASPVLEGSGLLVHYSSGIYIINDTFEGFSGPALRLSNTSGMLIAGNRFYSNSSDAIYGEVNLYNIDIVNNPMIDASRITTWGHAIGLHSTEASANIENVNINSNYIINGSSFCVEVGSFGGELPTDVTIQNNYCLQAASAGNHGGYSLSGTNIAAVISNIYAINSAGYGHMAGVEAVSGFNATITNNMLFGLDISIDRQSGSKVSGNVVQDPVNGVGVAISSSVTESSVKNNSINDNTIMFTRAIAAQKGIWLQCNALNAVCSSNSITNNRIDQVSAVSGTGILVEDDKGMMVDNQVESNSISGMKVCVNAGETATAILNNKCN